MPEQTNKAPRTPWRPLDILVLGLATALVAASYLFLWRPSAPGIQARVTSPHQAPIYLQLDQDETLEIAGSLGPSHLQIKQGAIRFTASPCRAKRCIHRGWIRHGGELAACLPNRVAVEILDASNGHDAVVF